jgi:retron-type reverse transcriptase
MKRHCNLYPKIWHIKNLIKADHKAGKGKKNTYGVKEHEKNRGCNLIALQNTLMEGSYQTSEYSTFMIYEPKEREIFRLPYFPDRITHHAIMNIMEPVWVSTFTSDTYGCIKGRGIHGALKKLKIDLKDVEGTRYCLKMDIRKFYPSVDHNILKKIVRKKIKDSQLLKIIDNIIDSAPGIPIGNYLSQHFGNVYLSPFDHWIKEKKSVKYYYRYVDDIVILSGSKEYLHDVLEEIKNHLFENFALKLKDNFQVFPISSRGIDFVGYRFFHTHILLRKKIKKSFARSMKKNNQQSFASYYGWASHCNSKNLIKKLKNESIPNTHTTSNNRVSLPCDKPLQFQCN